MRGVRRVLRCYKGVDWTIEHLGIIIVFFLHISAIATLVIADSCELPSNKILL